MAPKYVAGTMKIPKIQESVETWSTRKLVLIRRATCTLWRYARVPPCLVKFFVDRYDED